MKGMLVIVGFIAMAIGPYLKATTQQYTVQQQKPTTKVGDITGFYRTEGSYLNKTYKGNVEITKVGDAYQLLWFTPNGIVQVGVGILKGDALSVAFYGTNSPIGVVIYNIKGNSQMSGEWTVLGADGIFIENLFKLSKAEIDNLRKQKPQPHPQPQDPTERVIV